MDNLKEDLLAALKSFLRRLLPSQLAKHRAVRNATGMMMLRREPKRLSLGPRGDPK